KQFNSHTRIATVPKGKHDSFLLTYLSLSLSPLHTRTNTYTHTHTHTHTHGCKVWKKKNPLVYGFPQKHKCIQCILHTLTYTHIQKSWKKEHICVQSLPATKYTRFT